MTPLLNQIRLVHNRTPKGSCRGEMGFFPREFCLYLAQVGLREVRVRTQTSRLGGVSFRGGLRYQVYTYGFFFSLWVFPIFSDKKKTSKANGVFSVPNLVQIFAVLLRERVFKNIFGSFQEMEGHFILINQPKTRPNQNGGKVVFQTSYGMFSGFIR